MEKFKFPINILLTKFPSEERTKSDKNRNSGDYDNFQINPYVPYTTKSTPVPFNSQKTQFLDKGNNIQNEHKEDEIPIKQFKNLKITNKSSYVQTQIMTKPIIHVRSSTVMSGTKSSTSNTLNQQKTEKCSRKRVLIKTTNTPSDSPEILRRRIDPTQTNSNRSPFRQSANLEPDPKHRLSILWGALKSKDYGSYERQNFPFTENKSIITSHKSIPKNNNRMSFSQLHSLENIYDSNSNAPFKICTPQIQQALHLPPIRGMAKSVPRHTQPLRPSNPPDPPPTKPKKLRLSKMLDKIIRKSGPRSKKRKR